MKTNLRKPYIIMAMGLLLVVSVQFIARRYAIADFWHGSIVGAGIGLELVALLQMRRLRKAE
ncbi:MAG: hypothetical protein EOO51_12340 [Flavobacterium sp.]|nr:MAG: hypothetical protein EOO51_12340 [Flavobacterium sp.]